MKDFAARIAIIFTTLVIIFLGVRRAISAINRDLKDTSTERKLKENGNADI